MSQNTSGSRSFVESRARLGALKAPLYPARWPLAQSVDKFAELLEPLTSAQTAGEAHLKTVVSAQKAASTAAAAEMNEDKKRSIQQAADLYKRAVDQYTAANDACAALIANLAEADSAGVLRASRVAEQKAISDNMANGYLALIVQLSGALGTNYTMKNLWTFFGAAPLYVSGGAIASFIAVDESGVIQAAGQERVHSGYVKAEHVARIGGAEGAKLPATINRGSTTARRSR